MTDTRAAATPTATLAILAGGEGSRMGRPKGELCVGGKPILSYLLDRFQWTGPTILVTAPGRERPPGAERFDREVTDPVAREGPLRGLITALQATETDMLVVASCDMPMVGDAQLTWLVETLGRQATLSVVMLSRGGRIEPFPLALRSSALQPLLNHFAAGNRSMRSLLDLEGATAPSVPVEWPENVWTNLNVPKDFDQFIRRLSS